jgi:hypothetical protein
MGDPMMAGYFLHPTRDALAAFLGDHEQGVHHGAERQGQPE